MHIHDVYCINMPLRLLWFIVLVFTSRRLFCMEFTLFGGMLVVGATVMISRAGYRWLLWILCRRYSFQHTACYCCDCYNWLCWFSLTGGDFLLYVLFLACCLLLLRLLQLVVLVFVGCRGFLDVCFLSGILFVVVATITMGHAGFWELCSVLCLFFAFKVFSLGPCPWAFFVTF